MKTLVAIPARFGSTRFPGKPLKLVAGVPLVIRVANNCISFAKSTLGSYTHVDVAVFTDDERIGNLCASHGLQVYLTDDYVTGTDRIASAQSVRNQYDIIINVQGDEPLVSVEDIARIHDVMCRGDTLAANAYCRISIDEAQRRSVPKVVLDAKGAIMYVSRAAIPFAKNGATDDVYYRQVCIYGFTNHALDFFNNSRGQLESCEDIEILRLLEAGIRVTGVEVTSNSMAVDYPDDIVEVEKWLLKSCNA